MRSVPVSDSRGARLAGGAGFLDGGPSIAAPGPHFSASLERGLAILEGFDDGNRLQGIADIADRLQMSRSTVHRYVITLQALGFLEQGDRRRYGLTLGVTELGCSATSGISLLEQARSFMQELARQTGFGVDLGILDGPDVLLVERIASRRRGVIREGRAPAGELRLPVYCTALGKLLLATVPADVQRQLLGELALERRTPSTIVNKRMLRDELSQISASGLAVSDEEMEPGLVTIAAAVRDESGEAHAALGLSAMTSTIAAESFISALGPHLQSTADQISARLGYRRAHERPRGAG